MKMVIVVRKDLKISCGKIAAQVAHAAVEVSLKSMKKNERKFRKWLEEGQKKVVVAVENEEKLLEIYRKALNEGLVASLIRDAGLTEIPPGTLTAVGIGPDEDEKIDKITGKLPLLR